MIPYLILLFSTTTGNSQSLRIPNAADSTNASPIMNSMNKIISANAINLKNGGSLNGRLKATLFKKSEVIFDVGVA